MTFGRVYDELVKCIPLRDKMFTMVVIKCLAMVCIGLYGLP